MIYGNISRELLLMTDELEPESLKMIKEHFKIDDDCSEYELLSYEIEWLIHKKLLNKELLDMLRKEDVNKMTLLF